MRKSPILLVSLAILFSVARAQNVQAFSTVSIKPNRSGAPNSETETVAGRVSLVNVTPLSLLLRAFGVQEFQLNGVPKWATQERYDVVAVTDAPQALGDVQRRTPFQTMLTERWRLAYHRETRQMNVLSLQIDKRGRKILDSAGSGEYGMKVRAADGRRILESTKGNIPRLVEILSQASGKVILDETGLSGQYDFTLEWVQDVTAQGEGVGLGTALKEQLGLALVETKRPIEIIVIDRFTRPTEN
jgi:uncharacterized protein (TIGR03435 family)